MRISDWSSDVCSSDLLGQGLAMQLAHLGAHQCRQRFAIGAQARCDPGKHGRAIGQGASRPDGKATRRSRQQRSEEHTSELQSLMRISYAVFCLKKKRIKQTQKK